jgi:hypothetical protein
MAYTTDDDQREDSRPRTLTPAEARLFGTPRQGRGGLGPKATAGTPGPLPTGPAAVSPHDDATPADSTQTGNTATDSSSAAD